MSLPKEAIEYDTPEVPVPAGELYRARIKALSDLLNGEFAWLGYGRG